MPERTQMHISPITDDAWRALESEAHHVLTSALTARQLVTLRGPFGRARAAVNLGRLRDPWTEGDVQYALRDVLPLTELRVELSLARRELDALSRGAKVVDIEPLTSAARALARAEDRAVYRGLPRASIVGLTQQGASESLELPASPSSYPRVIANAVRLLRERGTPGPYRLVLSGAHHERLLGHLSDYPAGKRVAQLITPPLLSSPELRGGLVLGHRDAFEMTLGEDFTMSIKHYDAERVTLELTESMTYRTLDPGAVIRLEDATANN